MNVCFTYLINGSFNPLVNVCFTYSINGLEDYLLNVYFIQGNQAF